mmetsp:Transcript_14117/g.43135  ORF Transcript_14117/g.43135 Transcript_14117/m.43135 type:complete len:208 (+) Transcript_14117:453-1076(+)
MRSLRAVKPSCRAPTARTLRRHSSPTMSLSGESRSSRCLAQSPRHLARRRWQRSAHPPCASAFVYRSLRMPPPPPRRHATRLSTCGSAGWSARLKAPVRSGPAPSRHRRTHATPSCARTRTASSSRCTRSSLARMVRHSQPPTRDLSMKPTLVAPHDAACRALPSCRAATLHGAASRSRAHCKRRGLRGFPPTAQQFDVGGCHGMGF